MGRIAVGSWRKPSRRCMATKRGLKDVLDSEEGRSLKGRIDESDG